MDRQRSTPIRRGDIYYADLISAVGSEQGGIRPVLVIQNDIRNQYSPTIIAAMITGRLKSQHLPTHVLLDAPACGLPQNSMVMLEQIRTLDRCRLQQYVGYVGGKTMRRVNYALKVSIGLTDVVPGRDNNLHK